jgi:MscS family membrane protein
MPGFARLLLLAVAIRSIGAALAMPFMERRFWSINTTLMMIVGIVWMLLLLTAAAERYFHRRLGTTGELTALLRLARRTAEVVVVASGVLATLSYFGVDPTAALAGLGIGGIAVALAAQKTLENVIGGLSIIFDKAVRVGDFLKLGETVGSVDYIGLRSTRIRTLDRTILSVPNGQLANVNIETLSARDKFWFHHIVALRYETTSDVMRAVVDGIRSHLVAHPAIDVIEPIRVRLFRLGPFSLDIEVFAYVRAGDWDRFLEIQQQLLLAIMAIVESEGTSLAFPTQTLHLSESASRMPPDGLLPTGRISRLGVHNGTVEPG